MIVLTKFYAYSDTGKTIHRIDSDAYGSKITLLLGDTADSFEEVDEAPKFTKTEYDTKVEQLIAECYTMGQEVQFAREKEAAGQKYEEYLNYVEQCKVRAVEELTGAGAGDDANNDIKG